MSRAELAAEVFNGASVGEVPFLDVLEDVQGNGFADEECGHVDAPQWFNYRVHRWIVRVGPLGHKHLTEYVNERAAADAFAEILEHDARTDGEVV